MHKARAFFYVCAGLFLLALAYHLGARNAGAQAGSIVTGFTLVPDVGSIGITYFYAMTPNGDVYTNRYLDGSPATFIGNFWGGGPVPTQRESFGALKSRYRGERGAAQPAPQDR